MMKTLWRRGDDDTARMIASLITQKDGLWNQLTLANQEQARLEEQVRDLERERDEWRKRASAS